MCQTTRLDLCPKNNITMALHRGPNRVHKQLYHLHMNGNTTSQNTFLFKAQGYQCTPKTHDLHTTLTHIPKHTLSTNTRPATTPKTF
jgi:hypothetical protein